MTGAIGFAVRWDEWERQSLDAAGEDDEWRARIRSFWDTHFPILLSVKTEDVGVVADSFAR
jgi:hypothetical protein